MSVRPEGEVGPGGCGVTAAVGLGPRSVEEGRPAPVRPKGEVGPGKYQSGWPDLNRRPPAPKAGALPNCATARGATLWHPQPSSDALTLRLMTKG